MSLFLCFHEAWGTVINMVDLETSYVVSKKVPCFLHVLYIFHRVIVELNVGEAWVSSQITKKELAFVSAFGAKDDDVFGVYGRTLVGHRAAHLGADWVYLRPTVHGYAVWHRILQPPAGRVSWRLAGWAHV